MTMRKFTAVFLCALILFQVFPAVIFGSTVFEARAEEVLSQPLSLENGESDEIEETPAPPIEPTTEPGSEPKPPDGEPGQMEEATPQPVMETAPPTGEPALPGNTPQVTESGIPPESIEDTALQAINEPAPTDELTPVPSLNPDIKNETSPEPISEPIIQRKPSKSLPTGASGTVSMFKILMVEVPSTLVSSIALKTPEYINLTQGDSPLIRAEVQTSGGNGQLLYAFDLYKDGQIIEYMATYGNEPFKEFTVTQPGRYHVLGFVYERETGTEQVRQSEYIGVSKLDVSAIKPNTSSAKVGDNITWSVTPSGATGKLIYAFSVQYVNGEYSFSIESGKITEGRFSVQAPLPATYRAKVDVYEPDIHPGVSLSLESIPGDNVLVSNPDNKVVIDSVEADNASAMIGEEIVWSVRAGGGTGVFDYKYQVYAGDTSLIETGWGPENYYRYIPTRSGLYRVVAIVRNRVYPSDVCSLQGDVVGVSGLCLESVTSNKTAAYEGDSVTWTANSIGGSGIVHVVMQLIKDEKVLSEAAPSNNTALCTFLLTEPGSYQAKASISDDYTSYSLDSEAIPVTKRPGAAITKTEAVNGSSIKITWKAVPGATGYILHRSNSKTGAYTSVYTGSALSRTDTGRTPGIPYYYKVSSYKAVSGITYSGDFGPTAIAVALAKPATPTAAVSSRTSVKVSWNKVTGASGYELWRSTSAGGTYSKVYRGTALSFANKSLTANKTYYYKVKAYKLVGTTSYYSPLSAYRSVKPR